MSKKRKGKRAQATQNAIEGFREKFEALDNQRTKHTSQAIEKRRHDVWEMMCEDIPQTEMAKLLNVSRATIALDVKYLKLRAAKRVSKIKDDELHTNVELGTTIKKLDSLTAAAFQEYATAKSGGEKAKFLDIATKTLSTKTRILQESGYLPKAGVEVRHRVEQVPTFSDRFGQDSDLTALDNPTSRHKLLTLAEKILRFSNVIDVSGTVKVSGGQQPSDQQQPPSNPPVLDVPDDNDEPDDGDLAVV